MPWPQFQPVQKNIEKIENEIKEKVRIFPKWLLIIVVIFLGLLVILASGLWCYQFSYQDKIFKGI